MTTRTQSTKTVQIFITGLTVDDQTNAPGAWAFTSRYLTKQQLISGCVPKPTSPGRMQVMALLISFQQILDNYRNVEVITNAIYIRKILKREMSFQANKDLINKIYDLIDGLELNIHTILVKPRLVEDDPYYHEFGYLTSQARKQTHRAEYMSERYKSTEQVISDN